MVDAPVVLRGTDYAHSLAGLLCCEEVEKSSCGCPPRLNGLTVAGWAIAYLEVSGRLTAA